jgi:hypothetical protein
MIDARAVGQELQKQLVIAARKGQEQAWEQVRRGQEQAWEQIRRGQEQARKGQEQVRRGQEQARKGQEIVTEVVRTLAATAEAFRPQLPTIKLPSLPGPALSRWAGPSRLPSAETVIVTAQEVAEQVLAAQRKLAEQVMQATGPLLAQGVTQLGRAAQTAGITMPGTTSTRPAGDAEITGHNGHAGTQHATSDSPTTGSADASEAVPASPSIGGRRGTGFRQTVPMRSRTDTGSAATTPAGATSASDEAAASTASGTGTGTATGANTGKATSASKPSTSKASDAGTATSSRTSKAGGSGKASDGGTGKASGSSSRPTASKTDPKRTSNE